MSRRRFWVKLQPVACRRSRRETVTLLLFHVSSSLVILAVTIQRQKMVTLLQYFTPYETKDVLTVSCSLPLLLSTALLLELSPSQIHGVHRVFVCVEASPAACLCLRQYVGVCVFSARSSSSQRRNWEESIAWGWCWGLANLRPVLIPLQLPSQGSPWIH